MKILKFGTALLCGAIATSTAAFAQNQMQQPSEMTTGMTRTELVALLNAQGLVAVADGEEGNVLAVSVSVPGGGAFYVYMRACEGAELRCPLLQNTAYFNAEGVTLGHINDFTYKRSAVSYAFLMENGQGILGHKTILDGGVTQANIIHELASFLYDAGNFMSSIQPGVIAEVNYDSGGGSVLNDGGQTLFTSEGKIVNRVGANAANMLTDALKAYLD